MWPSRRWAPTGGNDLFRPRRGLPVPVIVEPDELDNLAALDDELHPEVIESFHGEEGPGQGNKPILRPGPLVVKGAVFESGLLEIKKKLVSIIASSWPDAKDTGEDL